MPMVMSITFDIFIREKCLEFEFSLLLFHFTDPLQATKILLKINTNFFTFLWKEKLNQNLKISILKHFFLRFSAKNEFRGMFLVVPVVWVEFRIIHEMQRKIENVNFTVDYRPAGVDS